MLKRYMLTVFLSMLLCASFTVSSYAQEEQVNIEELKKNAPKVFVDCRFCDIDYIRTEITFVNYVWDRKEADVHILITTQRTGSGGREYTIALIGQKNYSDMQNTLKYISKPTDTQDEIRSGLVHVLKMGLVPYAARTPLADRISVSFKEKVKPTDVEDKWNFWVFSLSANSFLNGQKTMSSNMLFGNISANRVTPESKIRLGISMSYEDTNFEIDDTTISSSSDSQNFTGLYVKSISEHWSVGTWLSASSSTYNNINFAITPAPAVEYNLFPYSQSTRKQLRFLYKLGLSYRRYREETIYDKISENLLNESLSVTLELKEKWGTISTSLAGSHYFHDFSKYKMNLFANFSIRLFKGLSLNLFGSASKIHDQLSLPKGGASFEEILLRRRELATSYSYFASVGLSYSFGSIFSNVVNPRFGNGGGRGMTIRF